ncbi:MAG TPA: DUF6305 family protein [Rectinemataceae bacterium]
MKRFALIFALFMAAAGAAFAQPVAAFASKPALLTSVGQSADFEMIKILLGRSKIPYTADPLIRADKLDASSPTLVLVVGASSKGLGAAGISAEAELERTKALLKRAKELKLTVIFLHVGGASRRGAMSDSFIEPCVAASDLAIIVQAADEDGFLTKLTAKAGIALIKVDRVSSVGVPLAAAFK